MPAQPQLLPDSPEEQPASPPPPPTVEPAPIWLQRLSLFILVIFCIYLGVIVTVLPWWRSVWDQNPVFTAFPHLAEFLRLGPVRGLVSGLGLLDIWIGISEAIHYRDQRG